MPPETPTRPFSVAWLSDRLYRVTADHGPAGKAVEIDGWSDAAESAWLQLVAQPEVVRWVADYLDCRGDESLTVTFGNTSRVVGRRGYGDFIVSYPTDLLMAGEDKVSAMRSAILVVLDRHVDRRKLDVPLLSAIVGVG
ncbi:hypothetical protein [Nocardioides sp. zg-1228]|uniref:hypothetical protein n=1 Tax=Nocardioides sp. zg-1228 TaxID=2763008 RepID=UPI0016428B90|nr:hypothetical protein [Nocardioides sp. zg-1228]MBC2933681.1 hypothetical protein [Nocardioides sp. zg-1228]QSF58468.1 hypothetical protein JX575_04485 [Nocardioides sp. zg-1228]